MKTYKATLWDKIKIALDQVGLHLFSREWTPDSKDSDFCCIVCGRVHRFIISLNSSETPILIKKVKTPAKMLYTLDFCSTACANLYSKHHQIELYDRSKMQQHIKSGFWRNAWLTHYAAKVKE